MNDFELKEYYNNIRLKEKDNYTSFTLWRFLKDMLKEWRLKESSRIEQEIEETILNIIN